MFPRCFPREGGKTVINLEKKTVAGLGAEGSPYWDKTLKGFGLRVRRHGGTIRRSWIVQYRFKGRQRKRKIGDCEKVNCDMARAEAKRILAEVALGRDPQCDREAERQNSTRTLIAAINAYLDVKQMQFERGQYRKASLP